MRDLVIGGKHPNGGLVYIPKQIRFRHCYIIGKTGAGKSSLLHRMILQDVKRDHAVVLFDAGDLVPDLLGTLPDEVSDRLMLFSIERKSIIPYNPLLRRKGEPGRLESELYDLLDQATAEASNTAPLTARMKRLLAEVLRGVFCDRENPTISDIITYALTHKAKLAEALQLRSAEFTQSVEGIVDRLSILIKDERLRRVLCLPSRLDFDKVIDEGKILLISLAGIEKSLVRLLGTLLFNGLEATVLERPQERRREVAIYIDEFQDYIKSRYATHNFQTIFAQGRRYGVSICVAHQDFATIDHELLHTIHSNAATIISFACGVEEAARMRRIAPSLHVPCDCGRSLLAAFQEHFHIQGEVTDFLLSYLPKYQAVARVDREVAQIQTYAPPKRKRSIHFNEVWNDSPPPDPFELVRQSEQPSELPQFSYKVKNRDTPQSDAGESPSSIEIPSIPAKKVSIKEIKSNEVLELLSDEEQEFLAYVAGHPDLFVTQIYTALKLSGYKGDKIKEALITKGFLFQEETRLGERGRLAKTLTLTPAGIKVRTGVSPGKGGDLHKQIQRMVKEQAELFGWKAKIEERIAGSTEGVDVGLTKDELTVGVEISVTTDADDEIRNIQKCLAAGYDYVICAVSNDATLKALKTKGRKIFPPQERCRIRYSSPSRFKSILQEIAGPVVSAPTGVFSSNRNQNQLLGIKETAVLLGVSALTLYTWVSQRKIPYIKVGRLTKFKKDDLTTWLERRTKAEERWNLS